MGIAILERKIAQGTINAVVDITRLRKTGLLHAIIKGVRMRRAFFRSAAGTGGAEARRGGRREGRQQKREEVLDIGAQRIRTRACDRH
jgi:hypothetical protein